MKKIITGILLGAVLFTFASVSGIFAVENENKLGVMQKEDTYLLKIESFKDFMGQMKDELKDINKTDLTSLEKLYNEAVSLEKKDKLDEADKKWQAFYKILDKYFKDELTITTNMEIGSFKDFMGELKDELKEIKKTDLTSLEKLYNEAVSLEKKDKLDEADKKWQTFFKILNQYFKDELMITTYMEIGSFEDFMGELKEELKDIKKTDLTSLEKLYNEAVSLEKKDKLDEADKKWQAFYKILDQYFKDEVSASCSF